MNATQTADKTANKTAPKTAEGPAAGAMPGVQDAARMMEDALRGWSQAMNTWMDAQTRLMTAAMGSMPAMPAPESWMPGAEMRRTAEEMGARVRTSANRVVRGTVGLVTDNVNEMASMLTEQSRFLGRLADRSADCMLGEHAARTPEAFAATARTMMTDCVENATAGSEQMVRLGAKTMDTVRTMVDGEIRANGQTCAGTR